MQQQKFDVAMALFRSGARTMPYNSVRYGLSIAVLYRRAGRPAESRRELESLRDSFRSSSDPRIVIGWFYLGELAREDGRGG